MIDWNCMRAAAPRTALFIEDSELRLQLPLTSFNIRMGDAAMSCGAAVFFFGALRCGRWACVGVSRPGGTDAIENSDSDMILNKVARLMW